MTSDEAMMAAMGIPTGFNTTKGKQVAGQVSGGARKGPKKSYRQYMNRKGGFNRPLNEGRK